MSDFRQVIMVVDVDPKFDFLQLGSGRLLVLLLLRDVVTELSEIDDLADGRVGGRGTSTRSRPMPWARLMASDNFITPSCSLVEPRMTRTSRARIRPFTRICCCRIDYLRAGDEGVRLTPSFLLSQSPVAPTLERAALGNLRACEERVDRSAAWPEPRGSSIRHQETRKVFLIGRNPFAIEIRRQGVKREARRNGRRALDIQ